MPTTRDCCATRTVKPWSSPASLSHSPSAFWDSKILQVGHVPTAAAAYHSSAILRETSERNCTSPSTKSFFKRKIQKEDLANPWDSPDFPDGTQHQERVIQLLPLPATLSAHLKKHKSKCKSQILWDGDKNKELNDMEMSPNSPKSRCLSIRSLFSTPHAKVDYFSRRKLKGPTEISTREDPALPRTVTTDPGGFCA